MKTIIIAFVCLLFAKITVAQQDLLSFDEHNKYIYYQVIDMPGLPADTLHTRALTFLKTEYPKFRIKANPSLTDISGEGKFLTYGGVSVLRHESGEITYLLNVEFKDGKYRFWLTGFTFTPYVRDRYGNFVPEQGVVIPLEAANSKLDKKDVDSYLNDAGFFCKQFADRIKLYMAKAPAPKKAEIAKKVVTDSW